MIEKLTYFYYLAKVHIFISKGKVNYFDFSSDFKFFFLRKVFITDIIGTIFTIKNFVSCSYFYQRYFKLKQHSMNENSVFTSNE